MSQSLSTELATFVYRGLLLHGDEDDPLRFLADLAASTLRGEVSESQAARLCEMVGIGPGDRARAVEQVRSVAEA